MLGKLMKHEFRATARRMLPLFLVVVLLSCFLRISTAVIDHSTRSLPTILHMLNALLWVLFVLLLIGCVVFAVVVMVNRFYKNLLTDEGYLMFTLPVSIHKLLWSKLLVSSCGSLRHSPWTRLHSGSSSLRTSALLRSPHFSKMFRTS